jgi:hypothetical protein
MPFAGCAWQLKNKNVDFMAIGYGYGQNKGLIGDIHVVGHNV